MCTNLVPFTVHLRKISIIDLWPLLSDQTPTPTRFLKNCEEVGLFNELASSFEHEFKKASDDDEKKASVTEKT